VAGERLSYLLDVYFFTQEDIDLNSQVMLWPEKMRPIFEQSEAVSRQQERTLQRKQRLQLRFDCDSIIRPPFNSHSTELHPFDDLCYGRWPTRLQDAALWPK